MNRGQLLTCRVLEAAKSPTFYEEAVRLLQQQVNVEGGDQHVAGFARVWLRAIVEAEGVRRAAQVQA